MDRFLGPNDTHALKLKEGKKVTREIIFYVSDITFQKHTDKKGFISSLEDMVSEQSYQFTNIHKRLQVRIPVTDQPFNEAHAHSL